MSSYTLTIDPDNGIAPSTTVRVAYTADGPRITQLRIDAGTDDAIAPDALPVIDLGALLRALAPATRPAPTLTTPPAATTAAAPATAVAQPATAPILAPVTTPAPSPDRGTSPISGRDPRTRGRQTLRTPPAPNAASRTATPPRARGNSTTSTSAKPATPGRRPYRRAPHDLADVYRQASTAAGIADHYQVPLHTARNWINGARRKGQITTP